ncbi:MAG: restriction endonuclease subunit S [Candidatus Aenigmatarchaeota archaeon]
MIKSNKFKQTEIGKIPEDWEVVKLRDVASYISEKINIDEVNLNNFISTENMLPDKGGITIASSLPQTGKVSCFKEGDILFSNIRTYFKKLWLSKFEGGCSNDVLVIRTKSSLNNKYLYYFLSQDRFFEFTVLTSKGTKMPRGDKNAIMSYEVNIPPIQEQRAIASILNSLDDKIALNRAMNSTFEAIGQALFKHWFVDFEFPNGKGKPYRSNGGEMVETELGEVPKGWMVGTLGDYGTFKNGINYLRDENGDTEFFIANVRDIANNKLLLKGSLSRIKINLKKAEDYLLNDKDILIARSASPGETSLVLGNLDKVIYSGFSIRYRLNNTDNYLYFFLIIQRLKENLSNFAVGTTLQSVNQETLKNMKFVLPLDETLNEFNKIIKSIIDKTYNNLIQNSNLSKIRDALLPKLMSGEVRV